MSKTDKTIKYINSNTVYDEIMNCVYTQVALLGYDIKNPKERRNISHNEVNYILRRIYDNIFKPNTTLIANKKSLIDYYDIEQLQIIANCFIDICSMFSKSLGLMSFSYMTGIDYRTIYRILNDENENGLNTERYQVFKNIQECHKVAQISLLNDAPVGALAVANNDVETGLQWSANQTQQITANTVYLIPSERSNRLALEGNERT